MAKKAKSIIDRSFEFDENVWVVSVINTGHTTNRSTGRSLGHAAILVEGIVPMENSDDGLLFVGRYDIWAKFFNQKESCFNFNRKGYIKEVEVSEEHYYDEDYSQFPGNSYFISPEKANQLIAAIKADKRQVDDYVEFKQPALENLSNSNNNNNPSERSVNPEPLLFQLTGGSFLFAKEEEGINCAEWCMKKLQSVGIGDGGIKDKKPWIVSNSYTQRASVFIKRHQKVLLWGTVGLTGATIVAGTVFLNSNSNNP